MGIVCGLYRVEDKIIEDLIKEPESSQDWIDENYTSVFGKYHIENDTVFELDKGWAVAMFLLKDCDTTKERVLENLDGKEIKPNEYDLAIYIKSKKVKEINEILKTISEDRIRKVFNIEKMQLNNVYNSDFFDFTNWSFLMLHINTIKNAFQKATEYESGIIINHH